MHHFHLQLVAYLSLQGQGLVRVVVLNCNWGSKNLNWDMIATGAAVNWIWRKESFFSCDAFIVDPEVVIKKQNKGKCCQCAAHWSVSFSAALAVTTSIGCFRKKKKRDLMKSLNAIAKRRTNLATSWWRQKAAFTVVAEEKSKLFFSGFGRDQNEA